MPLTAIPPCPAPSLQRRYSVLLSSSFGAWRTHLLQEVAAKMRQLSALLHWERRVLSSAMAGWHLHVLNRAYKAEVSLAAQRHYVACLYTRAFQVRLQRSAVGLLPVAACSGTHHGTALLRLHPELPRQVRASAALACATFILHAARLCLWHSLQVMCLAQRTACQLVI